MVLMIATDLSTRSCQYFSFQNTNIFPTEKKVREAKNACFPATEHISKT